MSESGDSTAALGGAPRLLVLNNTTDPCAGFPMLELVAGRGWDFASFWAPGGEFPDCLDGFAGVLLTGSPHGAYERLEWIDQEHELVAACASKRIPMLGLCFGSQLLASALCGRDQVFRRSDCEVGHNRLEVFPVACDDPIFHVLPRPTRMFVWHNDEVRADHPDMEILAASDLCPNQIWRYRRAPAWGIQGHIEIVRSDAAAWFARNRERLERDGADVDRLVAEADDGRQGQAILKRFLEFCRPSDRHAERPDEQPRAAENLR